MSDHQVEFEKAIHVLKNAELRITSARRALLHVLVHNHGPFSVDDLLDRRDLSHVDRVTAYRCMTAFEQLDLVRRCDFGDGKARYEFTRDDQHHHHHVTCKRCRRSESLEGKLDQCVPKGFLHAAERLGYSRVSHSLEFFGLCSSCT